MASKKDPLPPKELTLFKSIVKCYELKQYKKGLKNAETILKKFPEHGETLSMKGLILNCLPDKKTEAYEYVRRGLKNDLRSHVCWHVFGLLYRSDHDYNEAIKCYRNALRIDNQNFQILRDLSLLQIQMRDLAGFADTRQQMLSSKPNSKNHWTGFAIAEHLRGNLKKALKVIRTYKTDAAPEAQEGGPKQPDYEWSEMLLYENRLLEEMGDLEGAYQHLLDNEKMVVDGLGRREKCAELCLKLGKLDKAEEWYRSLMATNPENHAYHKGLYAALQNEPGPDGKLSPKQLERLYALYEELEEKHPRSLNVRRIRLDFAEGERFEKYADAYLRKMLARGVVALFSDIRPLYSDEAKVAVIEKLFSGYVKSLNETSKFPGSDNVESPTVLLMVYYVFAQHWDHRRETVKALEMVDAAIAHTPTFIDSYSVKGRIFKHAGDLLKAHDWLNQAREMDLADRYLNTKCTFYALRADLTELAESTIGLFIKEGDDTYTTLTDMQCMWYETELAASYIRQGKYGKAIKNYMHVDKHFGEIVEDQFDFHSYCLRKNTLRAYVDLLRFEDKVYGHKYYKRAARGIIQSYILLHCRPNVDDSKDGNADTAGMTEAELKKHQSKLRKAEAKKKAEEAARKAEEADTSKQGDDKKKQKGKEDKKPVDEDPEGEKYTKETDPLGKATPFLKMLMRYAADDVETHISAIDLCTLKKKYLMVLKSINAARRIAPEHPEIHRRLVKFLKEVDTVAKSANSVVGSVLLGEKEKILAGKTLAQFNEEYHKRNKGSYPAVVAAAEMSALLNPAKKGDAVALIADVPKGAALKDCVDGFTLLKESMDDSKHLDAMKKRCRELFPYSTFFGADC